MTEFNEQSEQIANSLHGDSHPVIHLGHNEAYDDLTPTFDPTAMGDMGANGNAVLSEDGQKEMADIDIQKDAYGSTEIIDNSRSAQYLEDYKCPICLDTFINTVKVDCSYGHKFCNFCIQSWINFERHLVTECPVCRGPIFGKSLDLKTDAEIRAIYDTLSEDDKRARLVSIKERLQLEYPNSQINGQQPSVAFQVPMRVSDSTHHHFNHDLRIPIPLVGVMEGRNMQHTAISHEQDYFQSYGEGTAQQVLPQGIFYPDPAGWNESYSLNFQNTHPNMNSQEAYQTQQQPVDHTDAHVHHQHFHHQNQETSSRWNNSLYLTVDETPPNTSPPGRIFAVPAGMSRTQLEMGRQNHMQDAPSLIHSYQATPHQGGMINAFQDHNHNMRISSPVPVMNYSQPPSSPNVIQLEQYPMSYPHHSSMTQISMQPSASSNHFNGFYCCYLPTCSSHCAGPSSQFVRQNVSPPTNSYAQAIMCPTRRRPTTCPTNIQNGGSSAVGTAPIDINGLRNGNRSPVPQVSSRIRPNMPGVSSSSIQLPNPNTARPRTPTSVAHHCNSPTSGRGNNAQARIRQPVSRCPARNNRSQFAGGFSLFSSGYMRFQISHVPTTMVVGERYVPTPPARVTHPLVSLIPLNQDGSSSRVSLTFEVHRS